MNQKEIYRQVEILHAQLEYFKNRRLKAISQSEKSKLIDEINTLNAIVREDYAAIRKLTFTRNLFGFLSILMIILTAIVYHVALGTVHGA